ncbi:MAG: hypothetical protein ACYTEQ_01350 [Planctomycetota bacterium]|jgi:hypothetical protein
MAGKNILRVQQETIDQGVKVDSFGRGNPHETVFNDEVTGVIRLGLVREVQATGPSGEQRFQVETLNSITKIPTGLFLNRVVVIDDTAGALAVGANVAVFQPNNGGAAIIVGSSASTVIPLHSHQTRIGGGPLMIRGPAA